MNDVEEMADAREIKETYEWRLQGFRDEVKRLVAENNRLRKGIESYLLRYEPEELVREDGVIIHELKELIE